jgi:hypothetical protein
MSPQNAKQIGREMQQTKRLLWNIQSKTPGIFHVFFSVSGASFQQSKLVGNHTRSLEKSEYLQHLQLLNENFIQILRI